MFVDRVPFRVMNRGGSHPSEGWWGEDGVAVVRRDFPDKSGPELRLAGCLGVSWSDSSRQET